MDITKWSVPEGQLPACGRGSEVCRSPKGGLGLFHLSASNAQPALRRDMGRGQADWRAEDTRGVRAQTEAPR